jgi:transcriptional regulator with XRE-family HTH domain
MFGSILKKLRIEKSMTQSELAKLLNISPSTIGMYEQGRRDPDTSTVKFLAEFFNVSTDFLLGNSDSTESKQQSKNTSSNGNDIDSLSDPAKNNNPSANRMWTTINRASKLLPEDDLDEVADIIEDLFRRKFERMNKEKKSDIQ